MLNREKILNQSEEKNDTLSPVQAKETAMGVLRTELIIDIPVEDGDTIHSFTHRKINSDNEYAEVSDQVFTFITDNLSKLGVNNINFSDCAFKEELIKNSYDAYVAKGLRSGEYLQIKIVIIAPKDGKGEAIVKIKDNGIGFIEQPKSRLFNRSQVKKAQKPRQSQGKSNFINH